MDNKNDREFLKENSLLIHYTTLGPDLFSKIITDCDNSDFWHKFTVMDVTGYQKDFILNAILDFLNPTQLTPVNFSISESSACFFAKNCLDAIMKLVANQLLIPNILNAECPMKFSIIANFCPLESLDELEETSNKEENIEHTRSVHKTSYGRLKNPFLITFNQLNPDLVSKILMECNNSNYWHKFMIINAKRYQKSFVMKVVSEFLDPMEITPVNYTVNKKGAFFLANNCLEVIVKLVANKLEIPNPLNTERPLRFTIMVNMYPLESIDNINLRRVSNKKRKRRKIDSTDEKSSSPNTINSNSFLINFNTLEPDLAVKILVECNNSDYYHKFKVINVAIYEKEFVLKVISNFLHPFQINPINFTRDKRKRLYFLASNCLNAIIKLISNRLQIPNPFNPGQPMRITIMANFCTLESLPAQEKELKNLKRRVL